MDPQAKSNSIEGPGGEGLFGLGTPLEQARVVIVPVPFEATVSYGSGTARGPQAILEASAQVDLFDLDNGEPYQAGIAMQDIDARIVEWDREARPHAMEVIARGGLEADPSLAGPAAEVDARGEQVNEWLRAEVERLLDAGCLVGVVGGDHSVAYGSIAAHAARTPGLGVLHFDAHADLRQSYEGFRWSHASIFYNVREHLDVGAVVGVGFRDLCKSEQRILEDDPRFHALSDSVLRERLQDGETFRAIADELVSKLPEQVYVSFDIDGLDPSLCPHTGTPVPGGLSFNEAMGILKALVRSGRRIVGFDLCEVAPGPEGDEWDANVGARILYKLIGFALRSASA